MGRARTAGTATAGRGGAFLKRWLAIAACTAACSQIVGDFDRIVAIEILGATTRTVEEGDTVRLAARAVSAAGAIVPEAAIVWGLLDVDSGQVGFTIESETGLVTAITPGSGRVRARVDELTSGTVVVTVSAAPDSVGPQGATQVTVDSTATISPALVVGVVDLTTNPGAPLALAGKLVHFVTIDPVPGSAAADGFFLSVSGAGPGTDPHRVVVTTGTDGLASVVVARQTGVPQPDTASIDAVALTARGDTIAGSPVRFLVVFENN